MTTNPFFSNDTGFSTEQNLYEDLTIEAIQIFGHNMKYIPRDVVTKDMLFGEDIASTFTNTYDIEMYVENSEGYEGTELFQKFGIEIRDEATLVVARKRWEAEVGTPEGQTRPFEGDLVYIPFSKTFFEITFVEHEEPFYQLVNLPVYKLRVSVFEYNDEDLDIEGVNTTEIEKASAQVLVLDSPVAFTLKETITQASGGVVVTGELQEINGNELVVSGVTSSTGEFKMFVAGVDVSGDESGLTGSVASVRDYDDGNNKFNETNDVIQTEGAGAIFDPSNPFGEDW